MRDANDSPATPRGRGPSGLKQFVGKFCVSITLLVGLLAAGECIAYLHLPHGVLPQAAYKPYVLWQVARPAIGTITLSADGLRRTSYSHCEANEYTIWMFGSSSLWGLSSRDWETIPSMVAKHFEDSGRPVCVKNYGQPAWASTQEIIDLMLELKRAEKKPDVVIFYDGSTDSFLPWQTHQVDVHAEFFDIKEKIEKGKPDAQDGFEYFRNTNTYVVLQNFAHKLISDDPVRRPISAEQLASLARGTVDNYLKNMEILDALAAHFGFHYSCFLEPYLLAAQRPLSPFEELIRAREEKKYPGVTEMKTAIYELLRTVNRPNLVYLGDLFDDPGETFFVDMTHTRIEGNRVVADRISQRVEQLGR